MHLLPQPHYTIASVEQRTTTRAKVAAQPPDVHRLTTWGTLKSALQLNATLQLNASCGLASNFMTHNTFVTQHCFVTQQKLCDYAKL